MDLVPFQYPSAWDINEPYWPAQYDQSLGWPSQYDNTLGFPTGDAFSMIPAQMRQDPLMKKTIRNARRIVAPLKKILRADVIDKGDSFEVHADLPGVHKDDLDISMDGHNLTINGERRKSYEHDSDWGTTHTIERSHGKVTRTLVLPRNANMDAAVANFEGGVLKIVFPKVVGMEERGRKLLIA